MLWRLLESVHGHLGILATLALLHPAILLRKGKVMSFGRKWATALSALLVSSAFGFGLLIYGEYRLVVKREIFNRSEGIGMLFETKEHLAYAVLALTLGATVCAFLAPRERKDLRKAASWLFGMAAILCALTTVLGTYIASFYGFPNP